MTKIDYHEGDYIKAGQVLVQLDNQQEKSTLSADMTKAKMSEAQYDRDNKLLKRGFILQDTQYNQKISNQEIKDKIRQDLINLRDKTIYAPFSGIVGAKTISLGDYIQAGTMIVTLTDTQNLIAKYFLPSRFVNQIKLGQAIIASPYMNAAIKLSGRVSYIAPSIDPNSQTIEVHAIIGNHNEELKPGEFVDITQHLGTPAMALVIPTTSVIASLHGYYVYQVKNNKALKTPVQLGTHYRNLVAITHGLNTNDQVVIVGQTELRPGKPVKIVK